MMKQILGVIVGCVTVSLLVLGPGMAEAQVTANGSYYPTPAWDQTLPDATRYIILSNFNSEAVLDRDTGLVWERNVTPSSNWANAAQACYNKAIGGRKGFRPATVEELATLLTPTPNNGLGRPNFPFGTVFTFMWSSTTVADDPSKAWAVDFGDGSVTAHTKTECCGTGVWCVRGGHGYDGQ
jgi:hypothetical protein